MKRTVVMSGERVAEGIEMLADKVLRRHPEIRDLVLVGIRTGGAFLACRLQTEFARRTGVSPPTGVVDITLYRDDWTRIGPVPIVGKTDLPFSIQDRTLILVDDVLYTGRTVRAAMGALIDYGRPRRIELAVLVDRGIDCRELPIMANYTAAVLVTGPGEHVTVCLKETGREDLVLIEAKEEGEG